MAECKYAFKDLEVEIGIDEAGRGPVLGNFANLTSSYRTHGLRLLLLAPGSQGPNEEEIRLHWYAKAL